MSVGHSGGNQVRSIAVFFGYCQEDDQHNGDFVQELSERLPKEVRHQKGQGFKVEVFIDKKSIEWGQAWQERIRQGLAESAFLIPILSPLFLDSDVCRDEVKQFREIEKQRGRNDLILPIYLTEDSRFASTEVASPLDDSGQIGSFLSGRQWVDWRHIRTRAWNEPEVRERLRVAAKGLIAAADRFDDHKVVSGAKKWILDAEGKRFSSLHDALTRAAPQDTIALKPGTYRLDSLSIQKPIEITGLGNNQDVVLEVTGTEGVSVLADSVVLERVTIRHNRPRGSGSALLWTTPSGSVIDCRIDGQGDTCIFVTQGASPTIKKCVLSGAYCGLHVDQGGSPQLDTCEITRCHGTALVCSMGANPLFKNCRVYGNGSAGWLHAGAKGSFDRSNTFRDNVTSWNLAPDQKSRPLPNG